MKAAGNQHGLSEPLRSPRLRELLKAHEVQSALAFPGVFLCMNVVAPCPSSNELLSDCVHDNRTVVVLCLARSCIALLTA